MPDIGLSFKGDLGVERAMLGLAAEIRAKAIPRALKKAGAPIVRAARQRVPVDRTADPAGTLKSSIGLDLRRPKRGAAYVVFGARRGFDRMVTRPVIIAGEIKGGVTRKADPANYAHLVEFGHRVVVPKKNTSIRRGNAILASGRSFVPARPFLRPAMLASKYLVRALLIEALAREQARYLNRRARRAGAGLGRAVLAA